MIDDQDPDLDVNREGFDGPETSAEPVEPAEPAAPARPLHLSLNSLNELAGLAEIDTREKPEVTELPPGAVAPARQLDPARATVPGLFARRSVNLVIGSSTAGKTPLVLSQLENYLMADDHAFLGYPLPADQPPDQCAAIVCSGTLDSLHRRINGMQLEALSDPVLFPIRDWEQLSGETALDTLYRLWNLLTRAARRPIRFLFIDGLQLMLEGTGKVNDPRAVKDFYKLLNQFCLNRDCTVLATVGMAKMRKGEYYPILADRVYGSTMWAQEADTLIGIEQTSLHLAEEVRPKIRRVILQPKAHAARRLWADFDECGRMVMVDNQINDAENTFYSKLDAVLEAAQPGQAWTRDELNVIGDSVGASPRTLERWISSRCHESLGLLERQGGTKNRTYHKPQVN